jgi:hypothetical protein
MRLGSGAADASWLTTLPGCLLAGIGLGLTNTPVTNTTTGAVSSDRAGMASGIDMSARMVSLALNIALMGFVLASGVLAELKSAAGPGADHAALRLLAERIAAGDTASLPDLPGSTVHAALARGFSRVMLYGAVGVWAMAGLSLLVFNARASRRAQAQWTGERRTLRGDSGREQL